MSYYLILTDHGITTVPVQADTPEELAAFLAGQEGTVSAIELVNTAEVAGDGTIPPSFIDRQANRAELIAKSEQALSINKTFLALAAPTNAQALAQIQMLTRECDGLIRLLIGKLDLTEGT